MSCSDPLTCPDGNCPGCKNGQTWCQDPRCSPFCRNCAMQQDHDFNGTIVVIVIIICLLAILFIMWYAYGPQLLHPHSDHVRAGVIVPNQNVPNQ